MIKVGIVPTGTANLASVKAAFRRLGADPFIANQPDRVEEASHLMLPGVGAFGASMAQLLELNLVDALKSRISADKPMICICVGHQLLFKSSDESHGVEGLGIIDAHIERFPKDVRVPQFGWNNIEPQDDMTMFDPGYAYFANSYRATAAPGFKTATAVHGGTYIAAMERSNIIGCQFHPELSHDFGHAILSRFLGLN